MKTPVALALIIMGALLVATPAISDYLYQRNIVKLLEPEGSRRVTIGGQMGDTYRFGCWFTGSAMIATAVFFSTRPRRES